MFYTITKLLIGSKPAEMEWHEYRAKFKRTKKVVSGIMLAIALVALGVMLLHALQYALHYEECGYYTASPEGGYEWRYEE